MTTRKTQKMATAETSKARHRSFGKRKATESVPVTFDLIDGKYTFEAKPRVQGAVLLDFIAASADGDSAGAAELTSFILTSLKDDDERARFSALIHSEDPDEILDIEDLAEIVGFLVEEYTNRPTEESKQ